MDIAESSPPETIHALDRLREPVRLVVWDLDDAFWRGTLAEGAIEHRPEHEAIVIELAQRGIMSSICSKNERDAVTRALADRDVRDYFVFADVAWTAKGPRLAALVEAVQLRPASVLFIDDNHLMREEASYFVPGIGTADEGVIPDLLGHPLLAGKDDRSLSRLAQYKLLEQRHVAKQDSASENRDFLRDSEIVVTIDHDVEAHLDRAIELVNRTNQLNFTKRRLPEDPVAAREQLLALIRNYDVQSGLVRVSDRFGDYGHVGFYVEQRSVHPGSGLHHFSFSCRVLGLGVETWLYRRLGRPPVRIEGEVQSDILDETVAIDWINADGAASGAGGADTGGAMRASEVSFRGGCELLAVSHYCRQIAPRMRGEFAFNRDGIQIRLEHSVMARHAIQPPSPEMLASFVQLGFLPEDFHSEILASSADDAVWIMSFWAEPTYALYRHKASGALIPFNAFPAAHQFQDLARIAPEDINPEFRDHWIVGALAHLAEAYELAGPTEETTFKDNLHAVLDRLPPQGRAFVIGGNEWYPPNAEGIKARHDGHAAVNDWARAVIAAHPRAEMIEAADYLRGDADVDRENADHYSRDVYHRLFAMIRDRL